MPDPIQILTADHREVEQLFAQIAEAEEDEREPLVERLDQSLRLHMDIEESLVYPVVAREVDEEDVEEAEVEHGLAREGLDKLASLVGQPGFGAALDMVKAGIEHHVHEEEQETFPQLAEKLGADEREEMGAAVAEAKQKGSAPGGKGRASKGGTSGEPTKQELLERAREKDIPGRSSMTKEKLQAALDEA